MGRKKQSGLEQELNGKSDEIIRELRRFIRDDIEDDLVDDAAEILGDLMRKEMPKLKLMKDSNDPKYLSAYEEVIEYYGELVDQLKLSEMTYGE